ncbi:hypothetical protein EUGRSUZ_I01581 [Eucalyptus grandis]|uniref:Uncharacterized protein n=2 Tax=Eucalyptus grandis TaxID=71139 RepID=A0ACC3JFP9_EUCGR|nr:hypothetical protein EUGRSUZ_I01581 [Eucalyptus grandis]
MRRECRRVSPSNALHLHYPIRTWNGTSILIHRRHWGLRQAALQDRTRRSRPRSISARSTLSLFRPIPITRFARHFTILNAVRKFGSESTQSGCCFAFCNRIGNAWGRRSGRPRDNALTRLVSAYFDHSEKISNLCLSLYRKVHVASVMYSPLKDLLELLPLDADLFTQSHCDRVYDVFVQFDRHDNPLPSPDSHYFSDVRNCFSQLEQQLGHRCRKSKSRVKFVRRAIAGSALCLFGTVVAAVASAIGVTAHALIAFVSAPCLTMYLPHDKFLKKELSNVAQLDAAGKGCALRHDLDSIHMLVNGLHSAIESHRKSIRDRLERGTDKNPILDVVEKLRKDHDKFLPLLDDLKNHIGLCLKYVNGGRKFLLEEITFHRSIAS